MINKKIPTALGIGIILIIAITFGSILWLNVNSEINKAQDTYTTVQNKSVDTLEKSNRENPINQGSITTKLHSLSDEKMAGWKKYKNEKYGISFRYPEKWFLDGRKLSPQKIDNYEIGSDNASINFGLYSSDKNLFLNSVDSPQNPEILDYGKIAYQINNLKRNSPDSEVEINGLIFKKYDLIDYGQYEGDSAGKIIIFVSPKISSQDLFFVFDWQQFPGNQKLKINNSQDFIDIASTFKITDKTSN